MYQMRLEFKLFFDRNERFGFQYFVVVDYMKMQLMVLSPSPRPL